MPEHEGEAASTLNPTVSPVSDQTLVSPSNSLVRTLLTPRASGASTYHRLPDPEEEEDTKHEPPSTDEHEADEHESLDSVHGLRISFGDLNSNRLSLPSPEEQRSASPSREITPLRTPSIAFGLEGSLTPGPDDETEFDRSPQSSYPRIPSASSAQSLLRHARSSSLALDAPLNPGEPVCKTRRPFYHGRRNWLNITIMILSVYSTIFSGMWLGLATAKPRYGRHIMTTGSFQPSTASLLCAAFAKTIELSFVTVFVTFLGQVLSQRAFATNSKGITIAEMQMRAWVQQPGTLLTHWETARYAGATFLGIISLAAALMAMLYTTASDALVSPKQAFGRNEHKILYGQVKTIFANESYLITNCKTPMTNDSDPWYYGPTCMEIEHSGQAYHNYMQYLGNWEEFVKAGNGTTILADRPQPVGMLYDNTTVAGAWIEDVLVTQVSDKFDRVVNNVTLAMPLAGVMSAAQAPMNNILQPEELNGMGEYFVEASVPSPTLNVLCAEMSTHELSPLILTMWPGYNGTAPNSTNYPTGYDIPRRPSWLNETAVDDLFGFGEKYGRRPPVFPKLPLTYNTVLNDTDLPSDSLYLLITSPVDTYMLCSIRSSMTPACSTAYHASMSGGALSASCENSSDTMAYHLSQPEATVGVTNLNWTTVAVQWGITMSLNAGITDAEASNARLLSQLVPLSRTLDPTKPSIAEALAVLAGSTVLLSALDAPLIDHWNYSDPTTFSEASTAPQLQAFNATVRGLEYASGGTLRWQGIFYLILVGIFLTNAFCLAYFVFARGLTTDFVEPQNLFALALNSPPSKALDGCCGGGPEKEELRTRWHIDLHRQREHVYIHSMKHRPQGKKGGFSRASYVGPGWGKFGPGQRKPVPKRSSSSGMSYLQVGSELGRLERGGQSPVAEMFGRLSQRQSLL